MFPPVKRSLPHSIHATIAPLGISHLAGHFISQCSQLGMVIGDPSPTAAYIEPYGTVKAGR